MPQPIRYAFVAHEASLPFSAAPYLTRRATGLRETLSRNPKPCGTKGEAATLQRSVFGRQLADCSGGERLSIAGTANSELLLLAGVEICRRVQSRVQGVSCLGTGELGLRLIKNVEEMLRDGVGGIC